jgi:hypothetical protein
MAGTQGFPFGHAIAYSVTAIEIIGAPRLALGRGVFGLCVVYGAIYVTGIVSPSHDTYLTSAARQDDPNANRRMFQLDGRRLSPATRARSRE